MVLLLDPKGKSDKAIDESLHSAQATVSQAGRYIVLASQVSYRGRPTKKLIIYESGDAYLVDESRLNDRKVRIQDVLPSDFIDQLFHHFYDTEASDGKTEDDLDIEGRLIEADRARNTPGARRNERSTYVTSGPKRSLQDTAVPPGKRQRPSTQERDAVKVNQDDDDYDSEADLPDEWEGTESELESIRYDEISERFYGPNFMFLGQLACKDIGRAWIKMCHPRKQSQYPYNGGSTAGESERLHGYKGELSKPIWWPSSENWRIGLGCRHIEPDHLRRLERVFLLKHILRYGGQFTQEKLKESTAKIDQEYSKNWTPEKVKRLALIYKIRQKEMEYEDGLVDGDAKVSVPIPYPGKGKARAALKAEKPVRVKKEHHGRQPTECATMPAPTADMGIGAAAEVENKATFTVMDGGEPSMVQDTATSVAEDNADNSTVVPSAFEVRSSQDGLPMRSSGIPVGQQHARAQGLRRHRDAIRRSSQMQRALTQAGVNQNGDLPVDLHLQATTPWESTAQQEMPSFTPANRPNQAPSIWPIFESPVFQQPHQSFIASQEYTHDPSQARRMDVAHRPRGIRNPSTIPATEPPSQISPPRLVVPRTPRFAASSSGLAGLDTSSMTHWPRSNWSTAQHGTGGPIYNEGPNFNPLLTSNLNLSSANCSFSSNINEDSVESYESGAPLNAYFPQQAQDEELRQHYMNWLGPQINDNASQTYQPGYFGDGSMGFETTYDPYGPGGPGHQ
ncbi:hypothetical protein N7G274_008836 [Stereocaulon virgatum]|uniref:Subtelomeric hrmA-associated cluster protein AFUB-079030/YDR124W-like helical bundle domain-containing protein n=1 Tax=Stereocaulon virgatum TaxID=373712 RepID=A0ABR3ZXU4_9LECA